MPASDPPLPGARRRWVLAAGIGYANVDVTSDAWAEAVRWLGRKLPV